MNSTTRSRHHVIGYLLILGVLLISCVTDSNSNQPVTFNGSWDTVGLHETTVNNLSTFEGFIYAATDSGLHRMQTNSPNSWNSLGLQQKNVLDVVFLPDNKLLAALQIADFSEGISSLFLSTNMESWEPHMGDYGGETGEYTWIGAIDTPSKPSDTVFSRVSGLTVVRTMDGGNSWKTVKGEWNHWGGTSVLVKADPYHKNRVWAGGANAFSLPYLLKSLDGGDTWQDISGLEGVCYDVVSHPTDKNLILAGFFTGPAVGKSIDGGNSWNIKFEGIGTLTLTNSARNPEIVYASGRKGDGTLFFAASTNFGESWEMIEMPDSPSKVQVNDMVTVIIDGQEVLYLGTNQGVYSYRFEE